MVNNGQTIGYSKGFSLLQWTFIARAIVFRFAVGDIIFSQLIATSICNFQLTLCLRIMIYKTMYDLIV